jgi:hypothetical protein
VFFRFFPGNLPNKLVFLIGADEQGGGKTAIAPRRRVGSGPRQPDSVAVGAAVLKVSLKTRYEGPQTVIVLHNQFQALVQGKPRQGVPAGPVFGVGVNVGVAPEQVRAHGFGTEGFHALNGTGGAAGMEEKALGHALLTFYT